MKLLSTAKIRIRRNFPTPGWDEIELFKLKFDGWDTRYACYYIYKNYVVFQKSFFNYPIREDVCTRKL